MNRILIFYMILIIPITGLGQGNVREKVFLKVNSTDLITGQTMRFSCFVSSLKTGKISNLSKILYVELLNNENQAIYQTKVSLKDGRGHGEYFIPTLINTGSYHLVAYTRWMKNFHDFFHQPLVIVNPYEELDFNQFKPKDSEVHFYPESGEIIAGHENLIVIRIEGKNSRGISGRVVTDKNDQVAELKTNDWGVAEFRITPEEGTRYQLITEGDKDFQFYDLPETCNDCVGMSISQDERAIKARILNTNKSLNQGSLSITGSEGIAYSTPLALSGELVIPKDQVPSGAFLVTLQANDQRVAERVYWKNEKQENEEKEMTYETEQEVDIPFALNQEATLSMTINKIYDPNIINDLRQDKYYHSRLVNRLFNTDINQLSDKDINNLLVTDQWKLPFPLKDSVQFLPEYRTDFLEGYIFDKNDRPVSNLHLGLSIPGNNYQIQFARPEENGKFIFSFDSKVDHSSAIIKVLNDSSNFSFSPTKTAESGGLISRELPVLIAEDFSFLETEEGYKVYMRKEFYSSYKGLPNEIIYLDSSRVANTIQRSIFNQLENAYFNDTIPVMTYSRYKQIEGWNSYVLDDFTRFQTIRDTFIELIPEVGISRNENKYAFNMRTLDETEQRKISAETILLLDGVFTNAKDLIELSPFLIKRIDVLSKKYVFGDKVFDGIISFHSLNEDLWKNVKDTKIDLVKTPLTPNKTLLEEIMNERIPNFRDLLLWLPIGNHDGEFNVQFKTSKVRGPYEVLIHGISNDGKAVAIKKRFTVK